jgi:hypothetical protein
VALSPSRPPLAPWLVPAFGRPPVSLAGVLAPRGRALVSVVGVLVSLDVVLDCRDAVPVTSGGWLVSRCLGVSLSASRGDTDFVLCRPPVEGASLFGRAGGEVAVPAGRVSKTSGFLVTTGDCAGVKLTLVWPGRSPGPPESGSLKSRLPRLCPILCPASDSTSAASATPLKTPTSFGISVPNRWPGKRRVLSSTSSSSSSEESRSIGTSGRSRECRLLSFVTSSDEC